MKPLKYVLDEHLRGTIWKAIDRYNRRNRGFFVDAVRVGDPHDLPLGASDPEILSWAEANNRILLTCDVATMPNHLAEHLDEGHTSPGIFILRPASRIIDVVEFIALAASESHPGDWAKRITYIP